MSVLEQAKILMFDYVFNKGQDVTPCKPVHRTKPVLDATLKSIVA